MLKERRGPGVGGTGHPPGLWQHPRCPAESFHPPAHQGLNPEHLSESNTPPISTAPAPNLTSQLPSQYPHLQPSPSTLGCLVTAGPYEASSQLARRPEQEDRVQPGHAARGPAGFVDGGSRPARPVPPEAPAAHLRMVCPAGVCNTSSPACRRTSMTVLFPRK